MFGNGLPLWSFSKFHKKRDTLICIGTPYLAFNKSKGRPYLGNLPPTRKREVVIQTSKLMNHDIKVMIHLYSS